MYIIIGEGAGVWPDKRVVRPCCTSGDRRAWADEGTRTTAEWAAGQTDWRGSPAATHRARSSAGKVSICRWAVDSVDEYHI